MHQRHYPRRNGFRYGVYYYALPITNNPVTLPRNWLTRFRLMHFKHIDHGYRDGRPLRQWIDDCLQQHGLARAEHVMLVCMPRVLGYVFNPVSFWLCYDAKHDLRAVVCEVNNTFGETHCYVCAHADQRVIEAQDWLEAQKIFHVSPFLMREGNYKFCFNINDQGCDIRIDYHNPVAGKQLTTRLWGQWQPMTSGQLWRVFWRYPLVTLKTIYLIHYQAVKILSKGIGYIAKPKQYEQCSSRGQSAQVAQAPEEK